jgi:hypothetical protein
MSEKHQVKGPAAFKGYGAFAAGYPKPDVTLSPAIPAISGAIVKAHLVLIQYGPGGLTLGLDGLTTAQVVAIFQLLQPLVAVAVAPPVESNPEAEPATASKPAKKTKKLPSSSEYDLYADE